MIIFTCASVPFIYEKHSPRLQFGSRTENHAMLNVSPSILYIEFHRETKDSQTLSKIYNLQPRNDFIWFRANELTRFQALISFCTLWTGYHSSIFSIARRFSWWFHARRESNLFRGRMNRGDSTGPPGESGLIRGGKKKRKKKKDNVYTKNINLHAYSFETSQYLIVLARDIYFVPRWKLSTGFTLFLHRAQTVYKRISHILRVSDLVRVFFFIIEAFNFRSIGISSSRFLSLKGKNVDLIVLIE